MQLLRIRKATPAVTHAKTDSKVTRPRNKRHNTYSPSAAGKTSRQLPPSCHLATQLPEGAAGAQAHGASSGQVPQHGSAERPAEKNNIKKPQQKATWHTSEPL